MKSNEVTMLVGEPKPCKDCGASVRVIHLPDYNQFWVVDDVRGTVLNNHDCTGERGRPLYPTALIGKPGPCKTCGKPVRPVYVVAQGSYKVIDEPDENHPIGGRYVGHNCPTYHGAPR